MKTIVLALVLIATIAYIIAEPVSAEHPDAENFGGHSVPHPRVSFYLIGISYQLNLEAR